MNARGTPGSTAVGVLITIVAVVLAALGVVFATLAGSGSHDLGLTSEYALSLVFLLYAAVGALLVARLPWHPIGWIFGVIGLVILLDAAALTYATYAFDDGHPGVPGAVAAAWLSQWLWGPLVPALALLLLVFPDGKLPSRRWRAVAWMAGAAAGLVLLARSLRPGPLQGFAHHTNPVGFGSSGSGLDWLVGSGILDVLGLAAVFLAIASFVVRYRRAGPSVRLQLKWFVAAVVLLAVSMVAMGATNGGPLAWAVFFVAAAALPLAVAAAVLRYRLYEIDRIISRTLVYGALTVILGASYAGLVLAGQAVFSSFAGGSNLAIAISTLVVAGLFLPLRSRIQLIVDRRFNRRRYDAQQTLEIFGARLREQVELDALATELRGVVSDTMAPHHVSLWLSGKDSTRNDPVTLAP